jgi:hypothetical protein
MSDTLKSGQADARKKPVRMPQERRSTSRPTSRSTQVRARVSSRNFAVVSTDRDTFRADEEGVDADVPVDAKNASTSDFENCRQFSTASTPNLFFFKEERRRTKKEERTTKIA